MAAELRLAHTADLTGSELRAARALMDQVFGPVWDGGMTDADWEHALGGIHAMVWEDGQLIGHASVVQRQLLHRGRALRTGYVEGVAVRADRRRRGHAGTLMQAVERIIRGAYELGALGATELAKPLYAARGWQLWRGPTSTLTPAGIRRTQAEDGSIYVLALEYPLDLDGELTCDWREGDVW
jgi:aminoglycoside 2'-N-acetyltransferase I